MEEIIFNELPGVLGIGIGMFVAGWCVGRWDAEQGPPDDGGSSSGASPTEVSK